MGNPISFLVSKLNSSREAIAPREHRIGKLNDLERITLYKYIGSRVRAGHSVSVSLQKLLTTKYIRKTARMKAAISVALHKFTRGAKLAGALQDCIPSTEHMLILTGDQSGSLPDTLAQMADTITSERKMRRAFWKSLIPSFMLLGFAMLAIFGTSLYIVPQYRGILKPSSVHGYVGAVLASSTPGGLITIAVTFGVIIAVGLWLWGSMRTTEAPWRRWLENIPNSPYSYYRDWHSLLWIKTHLMMLKAGVMERDALAQSIKTSSPWLARRLTKIKQYIERDGKRLPEALVATHAQTNFPAPLLIEEIAQAGDAADISGSLEKALAVWEADFAESTGTSLTVFSGAMKFLVISLLFVIAGSIVSLVLAVMHQSLAGANLFY